MGGQDGALGLQRGGLFARIRRIWVGSSAERGGVPRSRLALLDFPSSVGFADIFSREREKGAAISQWCSAVSSCCFDILERPSMPADFARSRSAFFVEPALLPRLVVVAFSPPIAGVLSRWAEAPTWDLPSASCW